MLAGSLRLRRLARLGAGEGQGGVHCSARTLIRLPPPSLPRVLPSGRRREKGSTLEVEDAVAAFVRVATLSPSPAGRGVGVKVRSERKGEVHRFGRTLIRLPPPSLPRGLPSGRRREKGSTLEVEDAVAAFVRVATLSPSPAGRGVGVRVRAERKGEVHRFGRILIRLPPPSSLLRAAHIHVRSPRALPRGLPSGRRREKDFRAETEGKGNGCGGLVAHCRGRAQHRCTHGFERAESCPSPLFFLPLCWRFWRAQRWRRMLRRLLRMPAPSALRVWKPCRIRRLRMALRVPSGRMTITVCVIPVAGFRLRMGGVFLRRGGFTTRRISIGRASRGLGRR